MPVDLAAAADFPGTHARLFDLAPYPGRPAR
jgi:hypothetical protein